MRKIQCISVPRSGHHFLVNCLLKYYSKDLAYSKTSGLRTFIECKKVLHGGNFHYCEYYNHCKSTPCKDPSVNFQKNHDFNSEVQNIQSNFYIIQYRNPLDYLVAYYNWTLLDKKERGKEVLDNKKEWLYFLYTDTPTKKTVRAYLKHGIGHNLLIPFMPKILYWKNFVNKWIIKNKNPNTFIVKYQDFMKNPIEKLEEIIKFIDPQKSVDKDFIKEVISTIPVYAPRDITKFKFYDAHFFKNIEKFLSKEIQMLNLDSHFL